MAESPQPSPDSDKWARRRAVRRAAPVDPDAAAVAPTRPTSLNRAFVLWMVIGVPAVLGLVGIVVVAAAFNLRAGYRGARGLLTVLGALAVIFQVGFIVAAITAAGTFPILALLPLTYVVVVLAAVDLMWRPEVTSYLRTMSKPR